MRTIGLRLGDAVLLLERRDEQVIAYNALVVGVSMQPAAAGAQGEMSIEVAFVGPETPFGTAMMRFQGVIHSSHADWLEGRAGLAYEELPYLPPGICRYCRCTDQRPCSGGCGWLDEEHTLCSSHDCMQRFNAEHGEQPLVTIVAEAEFERALRTGRW